MAVEEAAQERSVSGNAICHLHVIPLFENVRSTRPALISHNSVAVHLLGRYALQIRRRFLKRVPLCASDGRAKIFCTDKERRICCSLRPSPFLSLQCCRGKT